MGDQSLTGPPGEEREMTKLERVCLELIGMCRLENIGSLDLDLGDVWVDGEPAGNWSIKVVKQETGATDGN